MQLSGSVWVGAGGKRAQSQLVPASSCTLSVPGIGSGNVAGMLNSTKGRGWQMVAQSALCHPLCQLRPRASAWGREKWNSFLWILELKEREGRDWKS